MRKPKITKTVSGKWHAQVYIGTDPDGKRIIKSITHPIKAEVDRMIKEELQKKKDLDLSHYRMTVGDAVDKYIELSKTLSPSTLAAYRKVRAYAFPDLMEMYVTDLSDTIIQGEINKELRRPQSKSGTPLSAKTIKNEWGVVSSSLRTICNKSYNIRLPKVQRKNKTLPEPDAVMAAIIGTEIELPSMLAIWLSFSLSEIRGLKASSIHDDGTITIDRVVVDVDNLAVVKETAKTSTRIRRQALPGYIADLIEQTDAMQHYRQDGTDGFLFPGKSAFYFYYHFQQAMEAAGIRMSFHDLRHVFASVMLTKLQVPERIVQDEGGWKTAHVMKTVYSNSFDSSRLEADRMRDEFFSEIIKKDTGNQQK